MDETAPVMLRSPAITLSPHDVLRLVRFYASPGFQETFGIPDEEAPVPVELTLDGFPIGFALVDSAMTGHGLSPDRGGGLVEIAL